MELKTMFMYVVTTVLFTAYVSAIPANIMDNSLDSPSEMKSINKVMKVVDYKLEEVKGDYLQLKNELILTKNLVEELKKEIADLKTFVTETNDRSVSTSFDDSTSSESDEWPSAREVVEQYTHDTDWNALREGLQKVLDRNSVEYHQLVGVNDYSWGHLWQIGSNGFEELATFLMDAGLPPNKTDNVGDTMLHGAAEGGRIHVAEILLEREVDVDVRGWRGLTPFNKAALGGKPEMVKWLADHGADVNSADDNGMTSLHFAAEHGHLAVVQLLVELGLDTQAKDKSGRTPLAWAEINRHAAVAEYLSTFPH